MKTSGEHVSSEILVAKFQPEKEVLPRMVPPKVGTPGQTTWKTGNNHRLP
jgi:hypothetical protein